MVGSPPGPGERAEQRHPSKKNHDHTEAGHPRTKGGAEWGKSGGRVGWSDPKSTADVRWNVGGMPVPRMDTIYAEFFEKKRSACLPRRFAVEIAMKAKREPAAQADSRFE